MKLAIDNHDTMSQDDVLLLALSLMKTVREHIPYSGNIKYLNDLLNDRLGDEYCNFLKEGYPHLSTHIRSYPNELEDDLSAVLEQANKINFDKNNIISTTYPGLLTACCRVALCEDLFHLSSIILKVAELPKGFSDWYLTMVDVGDIDHTIGIFHKKPLDNSIREKFNSKHHKPKNKVFTDLKKITAFEGGIIYDPWVYNACRFEEIDRYIETYVTKFNVEKMYKGSSYVHPFICISEKTLNYPESTIQSLVSKFNQNLLSQTNDDSNSFESIFLSRIDTLKRCWDAYNFVKALSKSGSCFYRNFFHSNRKENALNNITESLKIMSLSPLAYTDYEIREKIFEAIKIALIVRKENRSYHNADNKLRKTQSGQTALELLYKYSSLLHYFPGLTLTQMNITQEDTYRKLINTLAHNGYTLLPGAFSVKLFKDELYQKNSDANHGKKGYVLKIKLDQQSNKTLHHSQ